MDKTSHRLPLTDHDGRTSHHDHVTVGGYVAQAWGRLPANHDCEGASSSPGKAEYDDENEDEESMSSLCLVKRKYLYQTCRILARERNPVAFTSI
jgi:hypothetical protein